MQLDLINLHHDPGISPLSVYFEMKKDCVHTYCAGKPGTQWVSLEVAAAVAHPDLQVLQGLVAAAAAGGDSDHLDGVGLEEVHLPPGAGLLLGLRAPFAVVVGALFAVVGVEGAAPTDGGGLVGGFAVGDVRTWRKKRSQLS